MPAKKTTSSVNTALAKYAKDWDDVKTKPIDYGTREELPPGINNGVAQVTACKVDVYKRGPLQGELYFQVMARIITPETCYDPDLEKMVRVKGRFTRLQLPICDQLDRDRTVAQNLERVKDEIGKLGVDPSGIEITDINTVCNDIADAESYIRFRTWRSEPTAQWPNPRTQEAWGGVIENYEEPEPDGDEAVDETVEVEVGLTNREQEEKEESVDSFALAKAADNGDESAEEALTIRARNAGLTDEQIGEADSWVAVVEMLEPDVQLEEAADDYESLGSDADEGDEAAIERLTEEAEKAGLMDRNDFDDLSWSDVAKLLSEGGEGADTDWQPKVEEIYLYRPPKARKPVECEVTKVDRHKATVTLRNLDDDTEYANVDWADLTEQ